MWLFDWRKMDLIQKGVKKKKKKWKAIGGDKQWVLASFLIPSSLYDSGVFVFLSDLVSLFVHPKESHCDKGCADIGERRLKEWWRDRKGKLRDRVEVEFSLFYLLMVLYSAFSMLTMNCNLNCYLQKKFKWILSN